MQYPAISEKMRAALRAIIPLSDDAFCGNLTPEERTDLLYVMSCVRLALKRCEAAVIHAPRTIPEALDPRNRALSPQATPHEVQQ
jgi:hypothetical protein